MPRIRTLKPEHRQHRKVGALDHISYRLWVGMILEADDEGRLVYDPEALRVLIFGYHVKVTRALVEASTNRLAGLGLVCRYAAEGQEYLWFPSWHDHQKIDRPRPSLLPMCDASTNARRTLDESSSLIGKDLEGKGSEGNGREDRATDSREPSANTPGFQIPTSIAAALARAPRLGAHPRIKSSAYWLAEVRANQGIDFSGEILRAEAWIEANPKKAPRSDLPRFLHSWLGRVHREPET